LFRIFCSTDLRANKRFRTSLKKEFK
jgi:hypothetical protein